MPPPAPTTTHIRGKILHTRFVTLARLPRGVFMFFVITEQSRSSRTRYIRGRAVPLAPLGARANGWAYVRSCSRFPSCTCTASRSIHTRSRLRYGTPMYPLLHCQLGSTGGSMSRTGIIVLSLHFSFLLLVMLPCTVTFVTITYGTDTHTWREPTQFKVLYLAVIERPVKQRKQNGLSVGRKTPTMVMKHFKM